MPPWFFLLLGVALAAAGVGWFLWDRHVERRYRPLELPDGRSHVRILRDPEDIQEAARRAADSHMETVRRLAATEERWRQMGKDE